MLDLRPWFLTGYWLSVPCLVASPAWQAEKAIESPREMEVSFFYNLIMEVPSHHLCCIFLVRSKSLGHPSGGGGGRGDYTRA